MKAITLFNGTGLFSYESLVNLSEGHIRSAQKDRTYLHRFSSPRYFLSELFCALKKGKQIPDIPRETKERIWKESQGDKMLAFSLYLVEVI